MHVALVEDEKKLAETLRMGLKSEGYIVDVFRSGKKAEDELRNRHHDFDLVVLDLGLPERNGLEICATLRREGATVPILILTAKNSMGDRVTTLDAGADDFLAKPFDFEELLARMRALLRRPRTVVPLDITFADLVLSLKNREVTRAGKKIVLTVKEFDLLHYLLRNIGRVVPRQELATHVWGQEGDTLSNVVDVHVKNLRDKVDALYERKLIKTVRGIGYTIEG